MPVRSISEFCLQISRFGLMNSYVVKYQSGIIVLDTSMGAASLIAQAARHLGGTVERILLTHGHLDHVGSVDKLKELYPAAEIVASERETKLIAETARGIATSKLTLFPGEPQTPVKGAFKKLKNLPETHVRGGDEIGPFLVIDSPGHTPGHISFLDRRDGTLYAGDSLVTFGELRLPFDPTWRFPLPKGGTWHYPTALASMERIAATNGAKIERVLPGHGPAVENPLPALARALERGAAKLKA